jgi:uncharacterized lipoprotein NlpE involved in copper resistance
MVSRLRFKLRNMFLFRALLMASFFLTVGCTKNSASNELNDEPGNSSPVSTDAHSSRNSLDWTGTYQGIVPCADCDGIETVLTLNPDHTFELASTYLGKGRDAVGSMGTFSWNTDGNTITLSGIANGPNQYFVGENKLVQLDLSGRRFTGSLSDRYVLQKKQ